MLGSVLINNHRQRKTWVMLFFLTVAIFSLKHDTRSMMENRCLIWAILPEKIGWKCAAGEILKTLALGFSIFPTLFQTPSNWKPHFQF